MGDYNWVVQNNLLNEEHVRRVTDAVEKIGRHVHHVQIIPFSDEIERVDVLGERVIPYGSTKMTRLATAYGWNGLFFNDPTFQAPVWCKERDDMLNADALYMTIHEGLDYVKQHPTEAWFIRPVDDLKTFAGGLITAQQYERWIDEASHGGYTFDGTKQVVFAKPKKILAEWRYFVIDHKVIDGSMYRYNDRLVKRHETDVEVLQEAQEFAEKWLPSEVVVMDLALMEDSVKVIEFNNFNSSGFYDHDIEKIVREVTGYMEQK